jgi:folate-binding protein YgfZ
MTNDTMTKKTPHEAIGHWSLVIGHSGAVPNFGNAGAEYDALQHAAAVVPLLDRTQIELTGPDRAAFLHNLCTNDVKRLQPGQGCEAFFTNVQGRVIGHGYVFQGAESLIFETAPGQAATLLPHLDRYLITEKVELRDRSEAYGELLVAGQAAETPLGKLTGSSAPMERLSHVEVRIGQAAAALRRVDLTGGNAFLLSAQREAIPGLWEALCAAGCVPCGLEAFEMARIENGTPIFGQDISDKNFPQELARNKQAISFIKGCYLGQETVARIDALGHVNQTLCGLKFTGSAVPQPGTELTANAKVVGHITSAAFSPGLASTLALGYVRRTHNAPGTTLESSVGQATVVPLPVA